MIKISAILLGAAILARSSLGAQPTLADAIIVVVHDSLISKYEIEDRMDPIRQELLRQNRTQPEVAYQKLDEMVPEYRDGLIEEQLILHDYEASGYNLPESIIDEQFQEYIRSKYPDDRVTLIRTLQAEGKTYEQYRKEFRDRLIIQQMRYTHTARQIVISPHKIETYYVDHKDQFKLEDQVKLRMIVLTNAPDDADRARRIGKDILTKLNEGASFSEMASIYSEGSQRGQGGDWGWFETAKLRKELAPVAARLKVGEHSDITETSDGWCFVMLVEDKRPAHLKPLGEVRDDIEKSLLAQEHDRLQKQWIDRLKKKTFIRYF